MSKSNNELYEFSRFSLDVSERLLRRDGKRVLLTDKAFDTLCILVRRGGELVGKDELMNEVWSDSIVEENNLDQKISMLRQAFRERKGKEKFIETIRGRGYRFLPEVRRVEPEPSNVEPEPLNVEPEPLKIEQAFRSDIHILPAADLLHTGEHYETQRKGNVVAVAKWQRDEEDTKTAEPVEREIKPHTGSINASNRNKWVAAVIGVVIVVIAIAVFARLRFSGNEPQSPIDSIAVLPFENAAQDADAEYLSDGITESLINRLSQLSSLKVMSSGSVFRYKGTKQDVQKVGSELDVRAVLTGSVKQIGDQIVISVSLDDVKDNHRIWGEQYVRKFADILSVQNDIVQEVSRNLRVRLTGTDEQQLAKRHTENVEAYQLYLKGQYSWNKHTKEDFQKAIEYFRQALEKDPNYALAYSGLSASYGALGNNYVPPNEAFPIAKSYAEKALAIDDTLPEAHLSMGAIRLYYDRDFAEAEKELKRALSLDPNKAEAHHLLADSLEIMGRFDEAKVERKRALELEPLSPLFGMVSGATFYFAGQYDEATEQLKKTVDLEPRFYPAYFWLGQAFERKKMLTEAIETYQKGISQSERNPSLIAALGHAYAVAGQRDKAQESLTELAKLSKDSYIDPYYFAMVYAGLGDKNQTFSWLEKTFQDRSTYLIWLKVEPLFDPMRDDPRFQDLLRRIGLER